MPKRPWHLKEESDEDRKKNKELFEKQITYVWLCEDEKKLASFEEDLEVVNKDIALGLNMKRNKKERKKLLAYVKSLEGSIKDRKKFLGMTV